MAGRYASQTTVSSDQSKAEIERLLTHYGADQFAYAVGTGKDNQDDMRAKGRGARGERAGGHKLVPWQVMAIRDSDEPSRAAGKRFGVTHALVLQIRRRQAWAWLDHVELYLPGFEP